MSLKNPKDGNYAAWMVSNFDATTGNRKHRSSGVGKFCMKKYCGV